MELLLNAEKMKRCDYDTIYNIGIPSMVLMERAALAVADEICQSGCSLDSVLVICGSGNNGGDGFAVGRILDERGIRVTLAFVGKESSMTEETALQKKICEKCGMKISRNFMEHEYTVIVDAIFGIGLSRNIEGTYAEIIKWINEQSAYIVAADIPSGINADNGKVQGIAVKADLTVTFAYRKIGHVLYPGTEYCGRVVRRDIGITADSAGKDLRNIFIYEPDDLYHIAARKAYSNKGTYGKVLMIAGSEGMSGAACLAARAAYRSGCGLVRVFTPECNRQIVQMQLPEAIVTAYDPRVFPQRELDQVIAWADVIAVGPGLGMSDVSDKILEYVMQSWSGPLVIDADGLNLLAKSMDRLDNCSAKVILTPHIGEMVRLTGDTKDEILDDILHSTLRFSKEYRMICALKDARTVVSDGSELYINVSGNHGMAAGGAGDVLTGIISSLLAQKMSPFQAAAFGVYLHGLAGDRARELHGAYGMLAGDIADQVGLVLKAAEDIEV